MPQHTYGQDHDQLGKGTAALLRNQAARGCGPVHNGRVLRMRLARPADKTAVSRLIGARCDWLEERRLASWRDAKDDLVAQCDNPEQDVWVLDHEAAGVIGQTVVQEQGPPFGWNDAEQTEPALYLSGSVTDPAAKALRPGSLMAWWAVDLAARRSVPWVRRHAQVAEVAAYDQAQGFTLVREEQRSHARLYMLARKAERLDLSSWFGPGFREGTPVPPGRA